MTTKVLNLYAGIGGNRKLWEDVDVTAVEWDEDMANVYRDKFPDDTIIKTDAHDYLKNNYSKYDFIWASPPCPTHSKVYQLKAGEGEQNDAVYPDMRLYQEILFLKGYFSGDWIVENVQPWYDPLIDCQKVGRHTFWSNYVIADFDVPPQNNQATDFKQLQEHVGMNIEKYDFNCERDTGRRDNPRDKKIRALRNCVHPELGKHVFEAATTNRQTTADMWVQA